MLSRLLFIALLLITLPACDAFESQKTAVIDVKKVLTSGTNPQKAQDQIKKAQEVLQYNLNVINQKLSNYKNKELANAYGQEAARQLQEQMVAYEQAALQAIGKALGDVVKEQQDNYDFIVNSANMMHANPKHDITNLIIERLNAIAVVLPNIPSKIDNPHIPEEPKVEAPAKEESKPAPK